MTAQGEAPKEPKAPRAMGGPHRKRPNLAEHDEDLVPPDKAAAIRAEHDEDFGTAEAEEGES